MSFLRNLLGKIMPQSAEAPPSSPYGNLAMIAMGMIASGGLHRVLDSFRQNGLGDAVQSWVGTGANQPISGEQVQNSLGDEKLQEVSEQTGLPPQEAAHGLAQILPQLVDKLTPNGQMPDSAGLTRMLESLQTALKSGGSKAA